VGTLWWTPVERPWRALAAGSGDGRGAVAAGDRGPHDWQPDRQGEARDVCPWAQRAGLHGKPGGYRGGGEATKPWLCGRWCPLLGGVALPALAQGREAFDPCACRRKHWEATHR